MSCHTQGNVTNTSWDEADSPLKCQAFIYVMQYDAVWCISFLLVPLLLWKKFQCCFNVRKVSFPLLSAWRLLDPTEVGVKPWETTLGSETIQPLSRHNALRYGMLHYAWSRHYFHWGQERFGVDRRNREWNHILDPPVVWWSGSVLQTRQVRKDKEGDEDPEDAVSDTSEITPAKSSQCLRQDTCSWFPQWLLV